MNSYIQAEITTHIIEKKAKAFGASLAGITSISSLQNSPSYERCGKVKWPVGTKSVLVLALAHETSEPELDWWDDEKGGTPGNRQLIIIAKSLRQWLNEEFNINAQLLSYHVEGGIFLKDAAVLAGLGTIGKNNLVVTPEFGPRVRFRALLLDADIVPTGAIDFAPCSSCDMRCGQACPQKAFKNGSYSRAACNKQMKKDETYKTIFEKIAVCVNRRKKIKYCRACELACPVGR